MLTSFPFLLFLGTVLGFLSGLGVGGGSLLILWLTLVMHMPHLEARMINMLFFLPTALIATFLRWRQGTLDLRSVMPAIIGGSISAAIFSLAGNRIDIAVLKKLFGALLLVTGARELFYKPQKRV